MQESRERRIIVWNKFLRLLYSQERLSVLLECVGSISYPSDTTLLWDSYVHDYFKNSFGYLHTRINSQSTIRIFMVIIKIYISMY